jgi:hypothetical protein
MEAHALTPTEWRSFVTMDCVYGKIKIEDRKFSIYVIKGLAVGDKRIAGLFACKNHLEANDSVFGGCEFIFEDYSKIKIKITPYVKDQNADPLWFDQKTIEYLGSYKGEVNNYGMEGTLNSGSFCPAWIDIECDAKYAELRVLVQ